MSIYYDATDENEQRRAYALEKALQNYGGSGPIDTIVAHAERFEAYLKGGVDKKGKGLPQVDLSKNNHFFHDSLGCPYECDGDHNHPERP